MDVSTLIAALGGATCVAGVLGLKRGAVSMWGVRDEIPGEHHIAVWQLAIERGLDWAPPGAGEWLLVRRAA